VITTGNSSILKRRETLKRELDTQNNKRPTEREVDGKFVECLRDGGEEEEVLSSCPWRGV
jgi:hypothetical protein